MEKKSKKLTWLWGVFCAFLIVLVLILISLRIFYAQQLTTNPEELVEEYAKFLGGIISMLVGFFLVNGLWDQRMKAYQVSRSKRILSHFYLKINTFCRQIKQKLALNFTIDKYEQNQQRDHQVEEVIQKLRSLGHGMENYTPDVDLIDDETMRESAVMIWADIQTNLNRLPVGQDFRVHLDEFEETLNALIESTEGGMAMLRS